MKKSNKPPAPGEFVDSVIATAAETGALPRDRACAGQSLDEIVDEIGHNQLAWVLVLEGLQALYRDPRIFAAPAAAEFVRCTTELVRHATLTDSAKQAFTPLDAHLPDGALGSRTRKAQAARRRGKPADDPGDTSRNDRIREHHARLTRASRSDATSATAAEFGVSTRTVRRVLAR